MSGHVWLKYQQVCPDCGQFSFIFSRVGDGVALSMGLDHEAGWVPAVEVNRKASRFADRFARDPSLSLPAGWCLLEGPPQFVPSAPVH